MADTISNPLSKSFSKGDLKKINTAQAISTIVEIGASVGAGIAMLNDAKKAQQFEDYLSNLNESDKQRLINAIDNAKSEDDMLALIAATIRNSQEKRIENLSNVIIRQEQLNRQKQVEKIILASILGALVIVLVYLNRKKP